MEHFETVAFIIISMYLLYNFKVFILNIKGNRNQNAATTLLFSTSFAIAGSVFSYFSVTLTCMALLISCYLMKSFHDFQVYVFLWNLILENTSSNQQIFAAGIYFQDYTKSITT